MHSRNLPSDWRNTVRFLQCGFCEPQADEHTIRMISMLASQPANFYIEFVRTYVSTFQQVIFAIENQSRRGISILVRTMQAVSIVYRQSISVYTLSGRESFFSCPGNNGQK